MGILSKLFSKKNISSPKNVSIPTKQFNTDNAFEIYDMVNALSTVVASTHDSWLHVVLQDEDRVKGWPRAMRVSATIDDWRDKNLTVDVASFTKKGLNPELAKYLSSIPFTVKGDTLEYTFTSVLDYPAHYASYVINEMRNGASKSNAVRAGTINVTIQNRNGFLQLKTD